MRGPVHAPDYTFPLSMYQPDLKASSKEHRHSSIEEVNISTSCGHLITNSDVLSESSWSPSRTRWAKKLKIGWRFNGGFLESSQVPCLYSFCNTDDKKSFLALGDYPSDLYRWSACIEMSVVLNPLEQALVILWRRIDLRLYQNGWWGCIKTWLPTGFNCWQEKMEC